MPLFARMQPPALAELSKLLVEKKLTRGSFLFHEGDPGRTLFFVCTGLLKVTK